VWVPEDERAVAVRLARYCARNPVAPERQTFDRAARAVTHRSDKAEGPSAGSRTAYPPACPTGHGAMRIVAFITPAAAIDEILTDRCTRAVPAVHAAARSPPSNWGPGRAGCPVATSRGETPGP